MHFTPATRPPNSPLLLQDTADNQSAARDCMTEYFRFGDKSQTKALFLLMTCRHAILAARNLELKIAII